MNPTRRRLMMRRRARRLQALTVLVALILAAGFAAGTRGERWTAIVPDAAESTSATSPARPWQFLGNAVGGAVGEGDGEGDFGILDDETDAVGLAADAADGGEPDGGEAEGEGDAVASARPTVWTHVVEPGDTLSRIAVAYGVDVDTIIASNDLVDPDRLRPGDKLDIPSVPGVLHRVRRGESVWDIARAYRMSMDDIIGANQLDQPDRLRVGEALIIPGAQAVAASLRREAIVGRNGAVLPNFDWPVRGRISSRFGPRWGRMHYGLDIAVPEGVPVRAAAAGTVTFSGWRGGYGYLVIIDHGHGVETRYGHNSRLVARRGQRVSRGALIAYSGNTGNSTGPHVHFEIRQRGKALNPERYLRR